MQTTTKFNEALRREREGSRLNNTVRDAARQVSVPEATYRAWESGELLPTRAEFGRLCVNLRKLKAFPPERFAERKPRPDLSPVVLVPAPAPPSEPGSHRNTFGRHLRLAREAEQLSQAELGAVIDVTGRAVAQWEADENAPVREHYEALLSLLPDLRTAPEPDWKDIAKPDGGRGAPKGEAPTPAIQLDSAAPSEPAAMAAAETETQLSVSPPDPTVPCGCPPGRDLRALFGAFAGVRGAPKERWVLELRVDDGAVYASMRTDGGAAGVRVSVAKGEDFEWLCGELLADLERELEERIAALQALRGKIRP